MSEILAIKEPLGIQTGMTPCCRKFEIQASQAESFSRKFEKLPAWLAWISNFPPHGCHPCLNYPVKSTPKILKKSQRRELYGGNGMCDIDMLDLPHQIGHSTNL